MKTWMSGLVAGSEATVVIWIYRGNAATDPDTLVVAATYWVLFSVDALLAAYTHAVVGRLSRR
jgi:hypothetical protein